MSDPALGLLMLALIVVVIMMGFATAFTLMGLGMFFGFIAFYDPAQSWAQNRVFDLMVQRAGDRDHRFEVVDRRAVTVTFECSAIRQESAA